MSIEARNRLQFWPKGNTIINFLFFYITCLCFPGNQLKQQCLQIRWGSPIHSIKQFIGKRNVCCRAVPLFLLWECFDRSRLLSRVKTFYVSLTILPSENVSFILSIYECLWFNYNGKKHRSRYNVHNLCPFWYRTNLYQNYVEKNGNHLIIMTL